MNARPFITCRELIDFLADYLDGSLPVAARREFERHLGVCPSCVAYLQSYRRTIALGKEAMAPSDAPASGVAPQRLVEAVRDARSRS